MSSWDFACPDWEARLKAGLSIMPDLPLDMQEANRAVAIFNKLRLPDVPGQPPMSEAAGEWQRDIVRAIFGSMVDGERRVAEVLALVPKKNSKTTGGAALTLTAFLMNSRPRAELVYVGPTQEVADLAFQQTAGMIEADEYLSKRFHVTHHTKTIVDRRNKAKLKVKTFDMKVVTGSKPIWILLDELHLMSSINGADRIIGQIRGGMLPNPEAVLVMITTQADQPPAGAFLSELKYARRVRDGLIKDARLLPVLYEFPEAMQRSGAWRDPATWPMVLPNLGRSITVDRLIADFHVAVEKGEMEERRWASQHLNVQIGIAMNFDGWPGAKYWDGAADESITLATLIERSEVVTIGIDGGGLDDLLGLAVLGRCKVTRDWLLWCRAWCHGDVLDLRKDIAPRLLDFTKADDGTWSDLVLCSEDDPTQDIREVADVCVMVRDAGLLPEKGGIGVDRMGLPGILDELIGRGFDVDLNGGTITGIAQGGHLNAAIIGSERKLKDGTLWHAGQPMMSWCVGNAKVEMKTNARSITKQIAGSAKIDPLMATFDAVMLMSRNPEAKSEPTYQMLFVG